MYAKLFKSLFEGSMRGKSDVILVWVNLLANADQDGFVDRHFRAIADETGLPLERVYIAIAELESPDTDSRSKELEGRRIERMEEHRTWGWKIINHAKYRALRNTEERRVQNRLAQERFREKRKQNSKQSKQKSARSAHTDTDTDTDTNKTTFAVSDKKPIAQPLPPKIEFKDKEFKNISAEDKEKWSKAYPALNINQELLKMEVWVIANPKNRKSNWRRFIANWLSGSQDKAPATKRITYDEIKARERELARQKQEYNKPIPKLAPVIAEALETKREVFKPERPLTCGRRETCTAQIYKCMGCRLSKVSEEIKK